MFGELDHIQCNLFMRNKDIYIYMYTCCKQRKKSVRIKFIAPVLKQDIF
jgi:hypothetical protein